MKMNNEVHEYLSKIGRRGGRVGGKSRSAAKLKAVQKNIRKAQASRRRKG